MGGSAYFLKNTVFMVVTDCRRTNSVGAGLFADKYFETNGVTLTYFVMELVKDHFTKL
jgi:hypothetical protein